MNTIPSLKVRSFDHVTLVVGDLAATESFYVGILGLEKAIRPAFDFQGDWYEVANVLVHVILANEASGLAGPGDRAAKRVTRGQHLAFRVDDFNAAVQLLARHQVEIVHGPQVRPDGASQIYIRDPDGHLIEIFAVDVAS